MSTLNNNIDSANNVAQTNAIAISEKHDKIASSCVIQAPVIISGPSFTSTVQDSEVRVKGVNIANKHMKSGELKWMGDTFLLNGKDQSINIQATISTRVKRIQQTFAVNIGGMLLIPKDVLTQYEAEISKAKSDFLLWRDEIHAQHDDIVEAHKLANPDLAELITQHALHKDQTKGRYAFKEAIALSVSLYRDEEAEQFELDAMECLIDEIVKTAKDSYKKSFAGRDRSTQKAKSVMKQLKGKLINLSQMNEGIMRLVDTIEDVLGKLPATGWIEGKDFNNLARWTLVMANKDTLELHAKGNAQIVQEADEDHEDDTNATVIVTSSLDVPTAKTVIVEEESTSKKEVDLLASAFAQASVSINNDVAEEDCTSNVEADLLASAPAQAADSSNEITQQDQEVIVAQGFSSW
jgi:hypothetical protein